MGINFDSKGLSLKKYLLQWLKDYAKPNVSPTTYDGYEMIVKMHLIPSLGYIKLSDLKPIHIQSYQNEKLKKGSVYENKPLSTTTVLQHHRILSKALKQAVQWQLIKYNPCTAIPAPRKADTEIKTMTSNELKYIIDNAKEKMKDIITLAAYTGMRRSEITGLKWEDIDFINKSIYIKRSLVRTKNGHIFKKTKNKSSKRRIAITDSLINMLKRIKKEQTENKLFLGPEYKDQNLVFCFSYGRHIRPVYITHRFKELVRKLNLGQYSFHDLRHTHATLLLKEGHHPKKVQERLGHASISTTLDIYSHVTEDMQRETAELFDRIME